MKNPGILLGLGLLGGLLLLAGGSDAAPGPTPPPPPPPPPPPRPDPKKPTSSEHEWIDWTLGKPVPDLSYLDWYPGKDDPSVPPPPPPEPELPKAGERWQFVYSINRPLSFIEMGVAKSSFAAKMPDQTLESLKQDQGPPVTVTAVTTYLRDAQEKVPAALQKSDITATLVSQKRL